eukprot:symbB.v1.2.025097.t1/scaffold2416.1/size79758/3
MGNQCCGFRGKDAFNTPAVEPFWFYSKPTEAGEGASNAPAAEPSLADSERGQATEAVEAHLLKSKGELAAAAGLPAISVNSIVKTTEKKKLEREKEKADKAEQKAKKDDKGEAKESKDGEEKEESTRSETHEAPSGAAQNAADPELSQASSPAPNSMPTNKVYGPGTGVMLCNVRSDVELNNEVGVIECFEEESGRYVVHLSDGGQPRKLKADNLIVNETVGFQLSWLIVVEDRLRATDPPNGGSSSEGAKEKENTTEDSLAPGEEAKMAEAFKEMSANDHSLASQTYTLTLKPTDGTGDQLKQKARKGLKNMKLKKGQKTAEETARNDASAALAEAEVQRLIQKQDFPGEHQEFDLSALPYAMDLVHCSRLQAQWQVWIADAFEDEFSGRNLPLEAEDCCGDWENPHSDSEAPAPGKKRKDFLGEYRFKYLRWVQRRATTFEWYEDGDSVDPKS